MLQFIMWNGEKIWTKKIWIKKKFENFFFSVRTYAKPNLVFSKISFIFVGGGGGGGVQKSKLLRMAWNMVLFWNFWDPMKFSKFGGGGGEGEIRQKGFCLHPESKYERILYFKPCVYLAYFRSYGYLKIVKCIAMY